MAKNWTQYVTKIPVLRKAKWESWLHHLTLVVWLLTDTLPLWVWSFCIWKRKLTHTKISLFRWPIREIACFSGPRDWLAVVSVNLDHANGQILYICIAVCVCVCVWCRLYILCKNNETEKKSCQSLCSW